MSLVTTTQAVKQIHADCFVIEIAGIKGEAVSFSFFLSHAVRRNRRCLAFLCAFQTLISLLSLQYSLNRLKIHIMIMIMIMIRYWKDSTQCWLHPGGGGTLKTKRGVNYNKSSPKIQLLNCSSDSVSMM